MRIGSSICRRAFSVDAEHIENHTEESRPVKADWYIVGGFTRFASRRDLEMSLGNLQPLKVDPILDVNCYTTGKWAVLLPSINVVALRTSITHRNPKAIINLITKEDFSHLKLASKSGISDCTVRFKNVPPELGIDELRFFLQDYNLEEGPHAIIPFQMDKKQPNQHFLINFASPEDAERVVLEKCFTLLEGNPVQMMWYNC